MTTRDRLPTDRASVTRRFKIPKRPHAQSCPACGHTWEELGELRVYAIVGLYPDGRPGELFLHGDRAGSTVSGLLNALAVAVSVGLQHGVPLEVYSAKWRQTRFGAGGLTGDKVFRACTSMLDLIAQWLAARFGAAAGGKT